MQAECRLVEEMDASCHIDFLQFEKVACTHTSVCSGMFQLAFLLSSKQATLPIPWFLRNASGGDMLAVARPSSEYTLFEGDLNLAIDVSDITSLSRQRVNCRMGNALVGAGELRLCSRDSEEHDTPWSRRQCEEQDLSDSLRVNRTELHNEDAFPESPCLKYECHDKYPNFDFDAVRGLQPQGLMCFGDTSSSTGNYKRTFCDMCSLYMEGLQVVKLWFWPVSHGTWPANAACRNLMLQHEIHFRPVDSWFALGPALETWEFPCRRNHHKVSAWMDTVNVEQTWWRRDGDLLEDHQSLLQASANYVDSWFELE